MTAIDAEQTGGPRWWLKPRRQPQASVRLLVFPHAGGAAAALVPWTRPLPAQVDVGICQLPGRGARLGDPVVSSITELADQIVADLRADTDRRPVALFGHSMGAILAFEIARRLGAGGPPLRALFASGSRPPHRMPSGLQLHRLPDHELMDVVSSTYGGVPAVVLADPDLRAHVTPAMRADLQAIETYHWAQADPLDCPMVVYCGNQDRHAPPEMTREWIGHSSGPGTFRAFEGGHFFYAEGAQGPLLADLAEHLRRLAG